MAAPSKRAAGSVWHAIGAGFIVPPQLPGEHALVVHRLVLGFGTACMGQGISKA